jgi:hypothetical protein
MEDFMIDKKNTERLTIKLIQYTKQADEIYEAVRAEGTEKDFYSEVKPHVEEVDEVLKEWVINVKEWMKEDPFDYLFPQQIDQTASNLADVALQAFYPKTSYKRFKSHVQSVSFILDNVWSEIKKKCKNSE